MTLPEVDAAPANTGLPDAELVGTNATWTIPSGRDLITFTGKFLGAGSSHRLWHQHEGEFAVEDEFCRACRWFEPRIFRESNGRSRFMVHRTGASIVPGEVQFTSHEWFSSGYEVVEALTTRKDREAFLTRPAARALAQAAAMDDDLNEAYVNRAVS